MTWVEDLLYGITTGTLSTLFGGNALGNIIESAGVETFVESAGNFMLGVKDLILSLYALLADFTDLIELLNFLPEAWMSIILLAVGVVVTLRIYSFVKDIEILGNKI